MKDRVGVGQFDDRPVGENTAHTLNKDVPLERTVEIVHHEKPSAQQVFAQQFSLCLSKIPMAHFDRIYPWPIEDFVGIVDQIDHLFGGSCMDACKASHALKKLPVGFGEIGGPA